jgi:hypothetical protein
MENQSGNLIYIIGLLYSLIIIGIAMYIISKTTEETTRCNYLKDINVSSTPFKVDNKDIEILRDKKLTVDETFNLKIDKDDVTFVGADNKPATAWDKRNDFDVSYTIDGEAYQTRLKCNSGTFKLGGVVYTASEQGVVTPARQYTAKASDVEEATFTDVPSNRHPKDGILLYEQGEFCLINPYVFENYNYGIDNQVADLKESNLYSNDCLINYHLKTAYNCCAINSSKNSFVNECALNYCIDSGARCLDFEIYSVNDRAVVGVSSKSNNTNMKESYNGLDLEDVLDSISVRQTGGPLILHFRIKSDRIELLEALTTALGSTKITKKLASQNVRYGHFWQYGHYEEQAKNGKEPLRDIIKEHLNKFNDVKNVIISLDLTETKWRNDAQNKTVTSISDNVTKLWTFVNIMTPHQIQTISINKIRAMTPEEQGDLRGASKGKLIFVQPDPVLPHKDDLMLAIDIGCQLVAAPLQFTQKPNIIEYDKFFKERQYMRKEDKLIQDPIV